MKASQVNLFKLMLLAAALGLACVAVPVAHAQATVTAVPGNLSFGVPCATSSTCPTGTTSAPQPVSVSVTGSGSATLSNFSITPGANAGPTDFAIASNACTGTLTGPASCSVTVTFTPSQPPGTATSLESATLTFFSSTSEGAYHVALTGALGAIKLFGPVNVAASNTNAGLSNGAVLGNPAPALSCPNPPKATLSSLPDGSGDVLVDNYVTLSFKGTAVNSGGAPAGNVCAGGPADNNNGTPQNDCFSTNYQSVAGSLVGQDPDSFVNPGNPILSVYDDNPNNAGGVPAIDISSYLTSYLNANPSPQGSAQPQIAFLDGGGEQAGSTVFLVTNCAQAGVASGATVTGNPIDLSNPSTLVQTFVFDSTQNQGIGFGIDFSRAQSSSSGTFGPPKVMDVGIPQSAFAALVKGTSVAPAVCLRMTGELDANNNPLCKAYVFECPDANGNYAGANCPQSTTRDLLFNARFDTVDPLTFALGTGPGLLMGSDTWATTMPLTTCTFTDPNLAGQLCPQNPLTAFYGAQDPIPSGTINPNSTFVPVLNVPLPITLPLVTSENLLGWQNNGNVKVAFVSFPAIYIPTPGHPANGFKAAPIQSVTFGITLANTQVPDPTYPVPTDTILFNPGGASGMSTCPTAPGGLFVTSTSIAGPLPEGRYNLHYFATDCATTEELKFTSSTNPVTNWASFKTIPVGIDTKAPRITLISETTTTSRNTTTITVKYQCTDPILADGSAGSGVGLCGNYPFLGVASTPTLTTTYTVTGHGSKTLSAVDLAGNTSSLTVTY